MVAAPGVLWHLVGRGQGCCSSPRCAGEPSQHGTIGPKVSELRVGPCPKGWELRDCPGLPSPCALPSDVICLPMVMPSVPSARPVPPVPWAASPRACSYGAIDFHHQTCSPPRRPHLFQLSKPTQLPRNLKGTPDSSLFLAFDVQPIRKSLLLPKHHLSPSFLLTPCPRHQHLLPGQWHKPAPSAVSLPTIRSQPSSCSHSFKM